MKKIAFHTLGCKLNFAETDSIARKCEDKGFERVDINDLSDIYIFNTCSVTENADKEFKYLVNRARRVNPKSKIVAMGCYAQLKSEEILKMIGVDLVLGSKFKFDLPNLLEKLDSNSNSPIYSCDINSHFKFNSSYSSTRTRAFLKVQDGCDYKCTYCTIPLARGKSRSDSMDNIVSQAKIIAKSGVKEIVLTGVNVGDFGIDENGIKTESLLDLVKRLDEEVEIQRIRISSIEPNLLTDEIIRFISKSEKFTPHFHIPLQSGSDNILRKMKRRYLSNLYKDKIKLIKDIIPEACIGADVIVGFPGESEDEFKSTVDFIKSLSLSYLHVFSYSERANTEAIELEEIVPIKKRKERSKILRELSSDLRLKFFENQLFTDQEVLFEVRGEDGYNQGYTGNYIRVKALSSKDKLNTIQKVKLKKILEPNNIVEANELIGL